MRKFAWILVALAGCRPAAAPTPPVPVDAEAPPPVANAPWREGTSEAAGYEPEVAGPPTVIADGHLLLGNGEEIERGFVVLDDGKIRAVGAGDAPTVEGARVIDAAGQWITPGLIDTHSHLGVYPMPSADAHMDGNEMTTPVTPDVRAVDAVWVHDPGFQRALAGGVTTLQILPGSGNLIGGRAVTLKLRRATRARSMHFSGAPDGMKMACGENPKRVYGNRKQRPMTRMGNLATQRAAFLEAKRLIAEWDHWRAQEKERRDDLAEKQRRDRVREACRAGKHPQAHCQAWQKAWKSDPVGKPSELPTLPPARNLALETLAGAIEGTILVHIHCYRSDDMANMLALADEMGFSVRSFHHALEAYKIRHLLAARTISVSTWADWWGFKLEAYDGIQENLALVHQSGGRAIVHSDSAEGIRRLNQEAAKGMWAGRHAGIDIEPAQAMTWLTQNPAWALGVEDRVGTLEVGKDADVVVWDRDPFSVYASAHKVFVDGFLAHDRDDPTRPWSDFEASP